MVSSSDNYIYGLFWILNFSNRVKLDLILNLVMTEKLISNLRIQNSTTVITILLRKIQEQRIWSTKKLHLALAMMLPLCPHCDFTRLNPKKMGPL